MARGATSICRAMSKFTSNSARRSKAVRRSLPPLNDRAGRLMAIESPKPAPQSQTDAKLKIYFLPNLLTAGNLFCGFLALTKIVEADPAKNNFNSVIRHAIFLILLALIFDLF